MRRPLLLVLLALVLPLLGPPPAGAAEEHSWRGLDVPYLSGGRVHFRGNAAREPFPDPDFPTSLVTIAATRRSAVLQADERTLFELPAGRGELRLLTRRAVGVPMADPVGDWVFWTVERTRGLRLVGYDTRRDLVRRGPVLGRDVRVWAVDGATAYVDRGRGYDRWTPGRGLHQVDRSLTGGVLLTDVDAGRFVLTDLGSEEGGAQVRASDGTVLAELSGDLAETFDPAGRYLATSAGVWDSATGTTTPLRLGRWTPLHRIWAPSGELVVIAQDGRPERYEHNPARRFACDPATGACDRLPDPRGVRRYTVEHEPVPSSAYAQLGLLVGS